MKKLLTFISILIVVSLFVASAQNKSFELTQDEIITMNLCMFICEPSLRAQRS